MKKIFVLFITCFVLNSCSKEEGTDTKVYYELVAIQRCQMPYSFTAGQTYEFTMSYKQPSSCHLYKGVYFERKEGNTWVVAIQCAVIESNSCVTYTDDSPATADPKVARYNFTARAGDPYIFKIWTGKNAQGEDTYYDVEVPVTN